MGDGMVGIAAIVFTLFLFSIPTMLENRERRKEQRERRSRLASNSEVGNGE